MSVTREQVNRFISRQFSDEEIDSLIDQHIVPEPHGLGITDACLSETGTSVAAIIADLEAEDGDINQAVEDFRSSSDAILAAVFFYWRHKELFDAEITVRRSGFKS